MTAMLEIDNLTLEFETPAGRVHALDNVGLSVDRGECVALVGESGSGKSIAMMAFLQLLPRGARISGSARFNGEELIGMAPSRIRQIRGKNIGCIFQDPLSAFNPVLTIGSQIAEAIRLHDRSVSRREALKEAERLFEMVSIPQPARRVRQYPHAVSYTHLTLPTSDLV